MSENCYYLKWYARIIFISEIWEPCMVTVTIYSKKECHLCDIAKEELEAVRREFYFSYREVDIEKDGSAFEKFKYLIPVVEVDGEIVSTGRIKGEKIREILRQKSHIQ